MQNHLKLSLKFTKPPCKIFTSSFSNTWKRLNHSSRDIKHTKKCSIINVLMSYCFFKIFKQNKTLFQSENI